jgi:flavodoxin
MKRSFITLAAAATVALAGVSAEQKTDDILVLYYSQNGTTKTVAEELQQQLGADIATIEAVNPYPADYESTIARWSKEKAENIKPEIKPVNVDFSKYSTIFLGFPIWGGTYALPIATFVDQNALKGKTVVTFATFGSGGIGSATANLAKALPEANVLKGYGVRAARIEKVKDEVNRFLIENGYKKGNIEKLPEYSQQAPVTTDDTKVFNDACSGYRFPLGTPVTVSKRTTKDGIDYIYIANSTMPDGKETKATIYVTVPNGGNPEFTLVER